MAIHPAELTHRAKDDTSWDAGLHAEGEQGPIDVGLSLEPDALGVVVDAPGVGRLKVAFQLDGAGHARLLQASRRLADGRELAVATDETRTTRLEGQVLHLQSQLEALVAERDQAVARAAALAGEQADLRRRLEEAEGARAAALADQEAALARRQAEAEGAWSGERQELLGRLQAEQDQRLVALGEREKARAELERTREELGAGSATLMRELGDARSGREAAEAERARLSTELGETSGRLQALRQEHEAVLAGRAELEQEVLSSQAEVEKQVDLARGMEAELAAARAETERLRAELDHAQASLAGLRAELTESSASVAGLRAELTHSSQSLAGVQAQSSQELETLRADLAAARAAGEQAEATRAQAEAARGQAASRIKALEAELKGKELSETTLRRRLEALTAAHRGAEAAQAEQQQLLEEARSQAQRFEARWSDEQKGTAEAREVARELKAQLDQATQERDEARGIARTLHARTSGLPALEAELAQLKAATTAERQRLGLQIESLGRQLDQERSARARVLSELDALKRGVPPAASPPSPPKAVGEGVEDTRPFHIPKGLLEQAQLTNPGTRAPTARPPPPAPAPGARISNPAQPGSSSLPGKKKP